LSPSRLLNLKEKRNINKRLGRSILIIGVGNEFRSDDAVGFITVRKLKEKKINNADVIESDGDGASLMDIWQKYGKVIIVDAVDTNKTPGNVLRIDANKKQLPFGISSHSSHLFNVAEAVETSRVMGKLPGELIIYGIEGRSFKAGTTVSREVLEASDKVVLKIMKEISN
jgi:hydrogenase maturation protease